jgi:four helix bundle protein
VSTDDNGHVQVRNYKDLTAWQKGMDLVELVYAATREWPREELYGLSNQVRRAAVSVPSNIAEGQGRASTREFLHHLSIARGSLLEVETQVLWARRLGYSAPSLLDHLLTSTAELGRLINGLYRSLEARQRAKYSATGPPVTGHRSLTFEEVSIC